jgi:hypothetical protein
MEHNTADLPSEIITLLGYSLPPTETFSIIRFSSGSFERTSTGNEFEYTLPIGNSNPCTTEVQVRVAAFRRRASGDILINDPCVMTGGAFGILLCNTSGAPSTIRFSNATAIPTDTSNCCTTPW